MLFRLHYRARSEDFYFKNVNVLSERNIYSAYIWFIFIGDFAFYFLEKLLKKLNMGVVKLLGLFGIAYLLETYLDPKETSSDSSSSSSTSSSAT